MAFRSILLGLALLLSACDFTVPLANKPEMTIDHSLVGLWQRTSERGEVQKLLILPLNEREYLISFPANNEKALYARAWSYHFAGHQFVQLRWIGTRAGTVPDNARVYQLATYQRHGDILDVRMLNTDLIDNDISSTGELRRSIRKHRNDPNLFRQTLRFHRLSTLGTIWHNQKVAPPPKYQ